MKLLIFTDSHLRAQSDRPKWRVDDHYISQFEELKNIGEIANQNNVDMILSIGDFFHHPNGANSLLTSVINWIKTLSCPFYSVTGNHDCHGYVTTDKNNGLSVLFESGLIGNLSEKDLVWENEKVIIRGIDAFLDPRKGNYLFEEKYDTYHKLILSHNFIIPHEVPFDAVLPSQVATNATIVALGHYHQAFDVVEGNIRFINPGSISRWAINEIHQPKVLLLDTITNVITSIELKVSKDYREIFDLVSAIEIKSTEMNLQNFIDSLNNSTFENVDIENVVLTEGRKADIHKNVLDLALNKIQLAKAELK